MEKHACIFDMDGVIASSEKLWFVRDPVILENLFGKDITRQIGETTGVSLPQIHAKAISFGAKVSKEKFMNVYNVNAKTVYATCQIATGMDACIAYLVKNAWKIGVLSSSPQSYIDQLLSRLSWKKYINEVLSVCDNPNIKPKPSPKGYFWMINALGVVPQQTVAIEDSNPGIQSAKSAGIFTIGYTEFLGDGYIQRGADAYIRSMNEVPTLLSTHYLSSNQG